MISDMIEKVYGKLNREYWSEYFKACMEVQN